MTGSGSRGFGRTRSAAAILIGALAIAGATGCAAEESPEGRATVSGAESDSSPGETTAVDLPTPNPEPDNEAVNAALVGLTEAEAQERAAAAGYQIRIASVDGEPRALTMDFRFDRINVELENGVVTRAFAG